MKTSKQCDHAKVQHDDRINANGVHYTSDHDKVQHDKHTSINANASTHVHDSDSLEVADLHMRKHLGMLSIRQGEKSAWEHELSLPHELHHACH